MSRPIKKKHKTKFVDEIASSFCPRRGCFRARTTPSPTSSSFVVGMSFSSRRGKHSFSIRDASATSDIFDDDGWVVSSSSIRRKNASIKVDAVEDDDFDDDVFFVVVVVSPFASFPSSTVVVVDLVVLLLALVVLEVVLVMVVVVFFIVRDERETQLCGTKDAPFLGGKTKKI